MIPQRENPRIPQDMGCSTNAGRGGWGRNSQQGGSGQGGHGRSVRTTVPRKASEVGACKDLEGHIFIIGLESKGKDGYMLHTSMEKMTTYSGTKYGDEVAQEWTSRTKINFLEPAYSQTILDKHAAKVSCGRVVK